MAGGNSHLAELVVSQIENRQLGQLAQAVGQCLDQVLVQRQLLQVRQVPDLIGQRHQLVAIEIELA